MRLNSGLAASLVERLKPGMAERLDHLLTITLRFTDVKMVAEDAPMSQNRDLRHPAALARPGTDGGGFSSPALASGHPAMDTRILKGSARLGQIKGNQGHLVHIL